jgi:predicted O-methyltransferase YrrM
MPKGAVLVVDNLLWGGRAATGDLPDDPAWRRGATAAIQRFNQAFVAHPQLNAQVLPIGDGLGLAVRI